GQTLTAAIEAWKSKAAGRSHIDYGFHVIVSDASDATLAEIPRLVDLGYPSLKVFMINEFRIADEALLRVFEAARKVGVIVNVHAENGDMLDHCTRTLLAAGQCDPRYYAQSRPPRGAAAGRGAGGSRVFRAGPARGPGGRRRPAAPSTTRRWWTPRSTSCTSR